MTRHQKKKSMSLGVVMVLIIAMAMGFSDLIAENEADRLVHEFGDLLKGVEAEILSIPHDKSPSVDTTATMQTGNILSQIAYTEAFDEVIRKQIL